MIDVRPLKLRVFVDGEEVERKRVELRYEMAGEKEPFEVYGMYRENGEHFADVPKFADALAIKALSKG